MTPKPDHRATYLAFKNASSGPLIVERPALFSPAAAAQDAGTGKTAVGRFGPLYLPLEYTDWAEEGQAHVNSCYIGDWTPLSKTRVSGPQALEFLSQLGMNDLSKFEIGQVKHHVQLDENAWIASEGILLRIDDGEFVYTAGSGDWLVWQLSQREWAASAEDISPDLFIFGVQGPESLAVVSAATGDDLTDIRFNRSRVTQLNGVAVRVLRTGISGELGYEVHGPAEHADEIWSALVEAGAPYGIKKLGFRAQSIQHIESGIATNGLDYMPSSAITPGAAWQFKRSYPGGSFVAESFTDYFRRPTELGWGGRGALTHKFIGRDALVAEAEAGGPRRIHVGLTWNSDDVLDVFASYFRDGDLPEPMELPKVQGPVFDQVRVDGEPVGVSTGRTLSVVLRRTISLAVIDRAHAAPGTRVTVLWGRPGTAQREIRAEVTELPFKPDHRRVDVQAMEHA
ncbi:glycine cleavage T C-terminal barrel domain-containing protein [Agromyces sp. Soil535]|uniref:glycine cleavage T C-terminal barrel domain-containing protein n=1 Tax=Agromyces sp. Soil535 TaxID=1736390 RepID=UPI000700B53A|nr:glycine cleavage T C-terminal barrel domain-containing protein [Agromyces sp. Soil535]KRE23292.1 glycine cleavage protein T [Agromyces sp. Soil535]